MNYKKTIEVLEGLKSLHPECEEDLELAIKSLWNIEKAMGYSNLKE
jgi:hypothetical protein